jgi:hypothetical protein
LKEGGIGNNIKGEQILNVTKMDISLLEGNMREELKEKLFQYVRMEE